MVPPGLVEEKFESRFHVSTIDNQSIVTENRFYKIMEFPLKDKKRGKTPEVKVQSQGQISMRFVVFC